VSIPVNVTITKLMPKQYFENALKITIPSSITVVTLVTLVCGIIISNPLA
jgi:hypothetical protein